MVAALHTAATDSRGCRVVIAVLRDDESFMADGPCRLVITREERGGVTQMLTAAGWVEYERAANDDGPFGIEVPTAALLALQDLMARQAHKLAEVEARVEQYRIAAGSATAALQAVTAAAGILPRLEPTPA